jgi:transcriptional regulator with XRE-family HTH domain
MANRVSAVEPDGREIKALRERAGYTQAELADLVKRHEMTISKIERGKWRASTILVGRIARVLGVEPEVLIKSGSEEEAA